MSKAEQLEDSRMAQVLSGVLSETARRAQQLEYKTGSLNQTRIIIIIIKTISSY